MQRISRVGRNDWETPASLLDVIHPVYGKFCFDLAASSSNTQSNNYFIISDNSLEQPWSQVYLQYTNELTPWMWLNPPYNNLTAWYEKCYVSASEGARILMLVPASTETRYFHKFALQFATKIIFIQGRLTFVGATNTAQFPSLLIEWTPEYTTFPSFGVMNSRP